MCCKAVCNIFVKIMSSFLVGLSLKYIFMKLQLSMANVGNI